MAHSGDCIMNDKCAVRTQIQANYGSNLDNLQREPEGYSERRRERREVRREVMVGGVTVRQGRVELQYFQDSWWRYSGIC